MKHSKKIEQLAYAKRNLVGEYDALIKKHTTIKDIAQHNNPLEEALLVSIHAIEEVMKSLEEENNFLATLFKGEK